MLSQVLRLCSSIEWKDDRWIINCKGCGWNRSWPNFKVLSQHLLRGTEKTTISFSLYSQSLGQDLNPGPPKYEAALSTSRPWHSVLAVKMEAYAPHKHWHTAIKLHGTAIHITIYTVFDYKWVHQSDFLLKDYSNGVLKIYYWKVIHCTVLRSALVWNALFHCL
jgi:hypothetical protein